MGKPAVVSIFKNMGKVIFVASLVEGTSVCRGGMCKLCVEDGRCGPLWAIHIRLNNLTSIRAFVGRVFIAEAWGYHTHS
jgi:hypothetical protein